ncbi:MAG: hypothetical protein HY514_04955 [Candidatus Aenigmarchaeota archaeon]|nr:hypothetical protein [Candidatus Aenigmarchaeota archaeon]
MSAKQVDINKWTEIPCECGGMAGRSTVKYKDYEVRGWVCKKCKKEYIHPEDSLKISRFEALKKSRVRVKIRTVGQSLVITLPKEITELYGLQKGETVGLSPESMTRIGIELD